MQNDESLAFFLVGDGGDDENLLRRRRQLLQLLFDLDVRDHFAANLAEAAHAVGDAYETVFVNGGDVASVVPAVAENFSGFFRLVQIALHYVGSAYQKQAGLIRLQDSLGFRIDRAQNNSRQGVTDAAALGSDLAEEGGAKVHGVDGYHRRAFGAAVALERANPELVLESFRSEERRVGKECRSR